MSVTTEVVDDEEHYVVTAGAIITVTIGLERQGLDTFMGRVGLTDEEDNEAEELDEEDKDWPSHQGKTRPNRRRLVSGISVLCGFFVFVHLCVAFARTPSPSA